MSSPHPSGPSHAHAHQGHEHGHGHGGPKHPYWKRVHKDWKMWVVVVLMLGAMAIYLTSNDLSVQPGAPAGAPVQSPTP